MPRLAKGALLLLLPVLASCTSTRTPRVKTAKVGLTAQPGGTIKDRRLDHALEALSATRDKLDQELTSRVLLRLQEKVSLREWNRPLRVRGVVQDWDISFDVKDFGEQGKPEWSPSVFDQLYPVTCFETDDYLHHNKGSGAGVPLILVNKDVKTIREARSFRPGNALYVPGTALFDFTVDREGDDVRSVRLRLVNTMDHREVNVGKKRVKVAWDVTCAVEANLRDRYILENGLKGLLRPDKRSEDVGLFGINAVRPGQIPVVFVHGLDSSPAIWRNAVNEMLYQPELREKYIPLLFLYPSGLPVLSSAARLRESIQAYLKTWDPEGKNPDLKRMILVGHSMGGLLSRLQVIDSGDELWKAFFSVPVNELNLLPDEQEKQLQRALTFNTQPSVKRVIFIAVPHRGSKIADLQPVRWLVRLIKLPGRLADIATTILTRDPSLLNPALLRFHSLGLRSVDMLSPGHPYFEAIDKRKIQVPFHSIIGDRGKGGGEKSSDGFVPYWSSHLDGAESELIVPYGHSCTNEPQTISEIIRILSKSN